MIVDDDNDVAGGVVDVFASSVVVWNSEINNATAEQWTAVTIARSEYKGTELCWERADTQMRHKSAVAVLGRDGQRERERLIAFYKAVMDCSGKSS